VCVCACPGGVLVLSGIFCSLLAKGMYHISSNLTFPPVYQLLNVEWKTCTSVTLHYWMLYEYIYQLSVQTFYFNVCIHVNMTVIYSINLWMKCKCALYSNLNIVRLCCNTSNLVLLYAFGSEWQIFLSRNMIISNLPNIQIYQELFHKNK
jgi:hypothetical protein